jgi:threonine aldolase
MTDDLDELRDRCDRALHAQGPARAAELLATIPADTAVDLYGDGGVVAELETQVAALLGAAAAVYLPSGTMAQQAVLRVQADRRGRRTVAFHPMSHLDRHEGRALERLHALIGRPVGDPHRLLRLADLEQVAEPVAALVLELPQRDLGGQLPPWDELQAQVGWARERGAAAHLDGARLWEAAAGYERSPAEVAGLFDTAYVSFYKALGALPGCCLAGPEDVVAQVREWRRRLGGTLHGLWPGAASALTCLERRLPKMPGYLRHTRDIAGALRDVPGIRVVPDPPQTAMVHLLIRTTGEDFVATAREIAEQDGIWTWRKAMATGGPAVQRVELSVGDPACTFAPSEVADLLARFVRG